MQSDLLRLDAAPKRGVPQAIFSERVLALVVVPWP